MRTFVYIISIILLALVLFIGREACSQEAYARQLWQPVVVNVGQIAELQGVPVANLKPFAYRSGMWRPVVYQLDERVEREYFGVGDGQVNGDDELVMFEHDFGEWAPPEAWIVDLESIGHQRLEIAVFDTGAAVGEVKYVYVFISSTAPIDSTDYVAYDPATDFVRTSYYGYGHDSQGILNNITLTDSSHGKNQNMIDRMKVRAVGEYVLGLSLTVTEEAIRKDRINYIDGRVRVIRRLSYYVDLGKKIGPYSFLSKFGPRSCDYGIIGLNPPDDFKLKKWRISFDLNNNVGSWDMRAFTRYTTDPSQYAPGVPVYTDGVPIDFSPDLNVPRKLDLAGKYSGWNWFIQTSNYGSLVTVAQVDSVAKKISFYYKDEPTGTNDGTPNTGWDPGSWGDCGIKAEDVVTQDRFEIKMTQFFLGPNISPDSAEILCRLVSQPLLIRIQPSSYVPVELANFQVRLVDGEVFLQWTTASETNNLGFAVQRRSAISEWQEIGFVNGAGTQAVKQNYSFVDKPEMTGRVSYRLKQIDTDGTFFYTQAIEVFVSAPAEFALGQNYPNPFNPSTMIQYSLKEQTKISLEIYNLLGQRIAVLIDEETVAGWHEIVWNATPYPAGVYFLTMKAGDFSKTRKMVLIK